MVENAKSKISSRPAPVDGAADLQARRDAQAAAIEEFEAAIASGEADRAVVLDSEAPDAELEAALETIDARLGALRRKRDIGSAKLGRLDQRLADVRVAEAVEAQRAAYAAALEQRDRIAGKLVARLERLGADGRALLRDVAEAQAAVDAANENLPPGATAIAPVEAVRAASPPPDTIETRRVKVFVDADGQRLAEQSEVCSHRREDGKFDIEIPISGSTGARARYEIAELVEFDEVTTTSYSAATYVDPLEKDLSLPAPRAGDQPGWRPFPDWATPAQIFAELDRLEQAQPVVSKPREYKTTRFIRIGEKTTEAV